MSVLLGLGLGDLEFGFLLRRVVSLGLVAGLGLLRGVFGSARCSFSGFRLSTNMP